MPKIKPEIDEDAQRDADAGYEDHLRKRQEGVRRRSTRLGFYRACSQKSCRRAGACLGEGDACFRQWWPHVHPQVKMLERTYYRAMFDGAPADEAWRRASAASQEWWRRFMAGEFSDEARAFLAGPLAKLPPLA
jgi:hypothetical protein